MADNSWRNLEPWERVKWARKRRFESAAAAAVAVGMQEGTYRCYERGPDSAKFIRLDYTHARRFARDFKVRWEWLLDGAGEPWLTPNQETEETKSPNNLRSWREYRTMTAAELAKKVGTNAQTITDLETGGAELSTKWLAKLAPALGITPGYLLDHDPNDMDPTPFVDLFRAIPKERRDQALQILKTFKPYARMR